MSETPAHIPGLTRHCTHCGHIWRPRQPQAPKACPQCQSPHWNEPSLDPSVLHGKLPQGSTTIVSDRVVRAALGIPDLCTAVGEAVAAVAYLQQTIDGYRAKITRSLCELSNVKAGMDALREETQGLRRAQDGTVIRLNEHPHTPPVPTEAPAPEPPAAPQGAPPDANSTPPTTAPGKPPSPPPEALPGSSPPAPDPRRRRPARKPTRSSRRSRRPSG